MITLLLLHPLNKTPVQHWTFDERVTTVKLGRSTDNDVMLYSAVVSRHHVELRKSDQEWLIVSLGTNGTYLEGKRIEQVPVTDGVVIRLARSGPNIQIRLGDYHNLESSEAAGTASASAVTGNAQSNANSKTAVIDEPRSGLPPLHETEIVNHPED